MAWPPGVSAARHSLMPSAAAGATARVGAGRRSPSPRRRSQASGIATFGAAGSRRGRQRRHDGRQHQRRGDLDAAGAARRHSRAGRRLQQTQTTAGRWAPAAPSSRRPTAAPPGSPADVECRRSTSVASISWAWPSATRVTAGPVGTAGTIIATTDGGATWSPQTSNVTVDLSWRGLQRRAAHGWAVGAGGTDHRDERRRERPGARTTSPTTARSLRRGLTSARRSPSCSSAESRGCWNATSCRATPGRRTPVRSPATSSRAPPAPAVSLTRSRPTGTSSARCRTAPRRSRSRHRRPV